MAVSKRVRFEVLRRDGYRCRYCGVSASDGAVLTIDHVIPVALGGSDKPDNLVAACKDCNAGKASANPDAQVVAEVADDALRWAAAMARASEEMLADVDRANTYRQRFIDAWGRWTADGSPIDLPSDWLMSVDSWYRAGLPIEVLVDAVALAMSNHRVRTGDAFRYLAGICWRRVTALQEAARSAVANAPTAQSVARSEEWRAGYRFGFEVAEMAMMPWVYRDLNGVLLAAVIDGTTDRLTEFSKRLVWRAEPAA